MPGRSISASEPSSLVWVAPAGCPSEIEVRTRLSNAKQDTHELAIRGEIRANADEFFLDLRVSGRAQNFVRSLRATDCESLAASALWLIELAAVQLAAPRAQQEPQPQAAQSSSENQLMLADRAQRASDISAGQGAVYLDHSPPAITHDPVSAAESGTHGEAKVALAAGVGVGLAGLGLTGAAPELSVAFDAIHPVLRASLRVGTVLHSSLELDQGASLDFHSAYLALAACHDFGRRQLRTGPCAVLAGWLTFVGQTGLRDGRPEAVPWLNAGGAWHVIAALHSALQLSLELGVTVGLSSRPTFAVSGQNLAQVAPVAGYVRIGYGVELW